MEKIGTGSFGASQKCIRPFNKHSNTKSTSRSKLFSQSVSKQFTKDVLVEGEGSNGKICYLLS